MPLALPLLPHIHGLLVRLLCVSCTISHLLGSSLCCCGGIVCDVCSVKGDSQKQIALCFRSMAVYLHNHVCKGLHNSLRALVSEPGTPVASKLINAATKFSQQSHGLEVRREVLVLWTSHTSSLFICRLIGIKEWKAVLLLFCFVSLTITGKWRLL